MAERTGINEADGDKDLNTVGDFQTTESPEVNEVNFTVTKYFTFCFNILETKFKAQQHITNQWE